ncbi:MAG TPA: nickel-dependent hydrogenase large subunit [Negativicutes bacterium]|nr:nickel-dependent hydrogenase large subunit [Negativicutes bacterium]
MGKIVIDPVTRLEGHLKVEVTVEGGRVTAAEAAGTMYRGFETILAGRDPRDAVYITQRICGVCPVSHATAAAFALDDACGAEVPSNGRLLRNLILGGNFLQSHIIHFYNLSLPDYAQLPAVAPFAGHYTGDYRFNKETNERLVAHYFKALEIRRKCHEMVAQFGGKMPHQVAIIAGGTSMTAQKEKIAAYRDLLAEIIPFVEGEYAEDTRLLANAYSDYFKVGKGSGNFLSYGAFPLDDGGREKLFAAGVQIGGQAAALDAGKITEDAAHAWYSPSADGTPDKTATDASYGKAGAYSWVKAPRYGGEICEVGPLARMWISGRYTAGVSVMDRIVARTFEAALISRTLGKWLDELEPGAPCETAVEMPDAAAGVGLVEAPRGALGHWVTIRNRHIERYQAVVHTTWNASPRDAGGRSGALEQALVGLPVPDEANPLAVVRTVHSFDPCLACAVHVITPGRPVSDRKI